MLRYLRSREGLLFLFVYLVLAFIDLRMKLVLTSGWFDGTLLGNHEQLLAFTYTNNEQSRLLQFLIPEMLHTVFSLRVEHAYILQRFLFTFLTYHLCHAYLRHWFSPLASFAGVAFLAAIMPLSHFNELQESGPLLSLLFLLGFYAIREIDVSRQSRLTWRDGCFALVLFLGALNNETILILSAAYFFVRFVSLQRRDLLDLCGRTFLVSAPAWGAASVIRFVTRDNPHLGGWWHLPDNLQYIAMDLARAVQMPLELHQYLFLYPFLFFGAFWVYAFLAYREGDMFLRRASLIIPLFLAAHLVTGIIAEVRQLIPLSFLIIPMGLQYLERRVPARMARSDGEHPQ